jgi:tetratricopeptide (TPR) repeat protein
MRIRVLASAVALMMVAGFAMGQKVKSKKEADAFMAIQTEQNPDVRMKKVDDFVATFADTELKALAFDLAAEAAERKGDAVKAIVYSQNALEADPKDFQAMLLISGELARGTRENDLDKDEKLARAEKLANDAIATVKEAKKTNEKVTDEQWAGFQAEMTAQGHVDLGMIANARKKSDVAISEFKMAIEGTATPDPVYMLRLASAYNDAGKSDEALDTVAKVLATPNLNAALKPFAENEKKRAEKAKDAKK